MVCRALAAFRQRLQHDEEPALICCRASARESDYRIDRRILQHDFHVLFHLAAHRLERDVLCRLHRTPDASRILLREKSFGHMM